jgi:HEAT repeat protein
MPLFGPPNIEKLKAKRDVNGLIKAMTYKRNDWVRKGAAITLGDLGDRSAVEPLIAALDDPWYGVRQSAAQALGKIGDPRAVDPLIQLIKKGKDNSREAAVTALGEIGDARAVEVLGAALKDSDQKVHIAAIRALGKIYDSQALRLLVAELKRPEADLRMAAQMALVENFGVLKEARSLIRLDVTPLIGILNHNNLSICRTAATTLTRLGWMPETDEQKAWYWTARDEWEKCVELGLVTVEQLVQALNSGDYNRQKNAAQALEKMDSDRAVVALIAALDAGETGLFSILADVLATSGNPRAVKPLLKALWDPDRNVHATAIRALGKLYASGRLDTAQKQAILDEREKIVHGHHVDDFNGEHSDYEGRGLSSDYTDCHYDGYSHRDINVPGEEFPL